MIRRDGPGRRRLDHLRLWLSALGPILGAIVIEGLHLWLER